MDYTTLDQLSTMGGALTNAPFLAIQKVLSDAD